MTVGSCEQPAVTDEGCSTQEVGAVEKAGLPGLRVALALLGPNGSSVCPAGPWGQEGGRGVDEEQDRRAWREAETPSRQEGAEGWGSQGQRGGAVE